jgi:YegS/Rv2252/BmrU family lipid kinase
MRIDLVANPIAGGGRALREARVLEGILRNRGHAARLHETSGRGDARAWAHELTREPDQTDCLVVAGGDGTANEVVNGMIHPVTLAILPVGTANVVAREFALPRDPAVLADLIERGSTRRMDLGIRDNEKFLLGAGAGLDAAIVEVVQSRRGRKASLWKWVVPGVKTILTYHYPKVRVYVDGEVVSESAQYAIVGNCVFSAGIFPATPLASTDDGLLDVCLLHRIHPLKMLLFAIIVWRRRFMSRSDIVYRQGKEVVFEAAENAAAPLQTDGDPTGHVPAHFSVLQSALTLVVPEG